MPIFREILRGFISIWAVVHFGLEYSRCAWKLFCTCFIGSGIMYGCPIWLWDISQIWQNFPKILFVHHNKYQYLKFSPRNFIFTEGIKQHVRPFYPLRKERYPGGEIVRQGGPKQGIGVVSANLIDWFKYT